MVERNVKAGDMITFAEGEYSDYCVNGLVRCLVGFSLSDKISEWKSECVGSSVVCEYRKRKVEKIKQGKPDFLPWLIINGLVEDVDYFEVHTGSFYRTDISFY